MSFFRFNTFLQVALISALLSFCIKLAPAQSPPPLSSPPAASPLPPAASPLPPCNFKSSWLSKKALIDDTARNLTIFTLSFLANESLSFNFTTTYNDFEDGSPGLFFIFMRPQPLQGPIFHSSCTREQYIFSQPFDPEHVCHPQDQALISCADPYTDSDETQFNELLSLTYDVAAATLHLQEDFSSPNLNYSTKLEDLPLDAVDSTVRNEIQLTLLVGFITSGEASINVINSTNVTTGVSTPSPISESLNNHLVDRYRDDDNAKSNHKRVVVWVIVGVSVMALLMGLLILVLFIRKRRRRSLVISSRPAVHGAPPSAISRAPFSHHDLESSATPMMKAQLPFSPPHTSAFEISGNTPYTWMKQPNQR